MMYAVESKSAGRVLDMRDQPYSDEDMAKLSEAYGLADLVVHEDVDTSILQSKACVAVKIEDGVVVEDVEAGVEAEHEKAMAIIIELYRARAAIQAAAADGFSLADELAAVDARIKEVRGEVADIVARKVADAGFFTRLLIYLGLK